MFLKSFCGCMSLQSGVVMLAFILIQLAFVILVSNLHLISSFPTGLIFVLCFLLVLFITGVVMIAAAYKEKQGLGLVATLLVVVVILMFLVGSGVSFANQKGMIKFVCVENRCPESLWTAPLHFRMGFDKKDMDGYIDYGDDDEDQYIEPTSEIPEFTETPDNPDTPVTTTTRISTTTGEYDYNSPTEPAKEIKLNYKFGAAFFAAVTLFVINLVFFTFCAMVAYNYYLELKHIIK